MCAHTHTRAHTLTHAALALFPAMQLDFAPSNSWEYIPGEAERAARMQENFKREEGGSGWLWLSWGGHCDLTGAETARSWRCQAVSMAVFLSAGLQGLLHSPSAARRCRVQA